MTATLDPVRMRTALLTPTSPWVELEHHASIGSTNARAAQLGRPWVVVAADHQSAGRGRLGRRWEAPEGASVAVSATLPAVGGRAQGWVPLLTGLAVADAVEQTTGLRTTLKWPNDVLLPDDEDRKVCGILCEVVAGSSGPLVVVGAGVNVAQTREQLPVESATSIALALSLVQHSPASSPDLATATATDTEPEPEPEVDRTALVVAYLRGLADLASDLLVAGEADLSDATGPGRGAGLGVDAWRTAYRARCSTIGRQVRISQAAGPDVVGRAVDVDDDGRLVVAGQGGRVAWAAGDVVHVRGAADGDGLGR